RLTMRTLQPFVYPGDTIAWSLTVTNPGPTAIGITISNVLPSGVTFGSAVPSQGGCVLNGGQVLCNLGSVAPASNAVVTITATGVTPNVLTNRATALVIGNDPDL